MAKPTPPQAILLRDLSTGSVFAYGDLDKNGRCYRAHCYVDGQYKTLSPATFGVLIKKGWVERQIHRYVLSQVGREVLGELGGSDFACDRPIFTAGEITMFLRAKYPAPEWVFFDELRLGTGYGQTVEQRIDAWAMNTWPSKGFLKIAFEVKVYRSDFLKELSDPYKRKPALSISNQFYFIGPKGIIGKYEIPDECGLMDMLPDGAIKITKSAPERKTNEPSWSFLASLARRMQNCIERLDPEKMKSNSQEH